MTAWSGLTDHEAERNFHRFLEADAEVASLITTTTDLECMWDINSKLPTPREMVAMWLPKKRRCA